jgi:hypothetical protein
VAVLALVASVVLVGACGDRRESSEEGKSVADPDASTTVCDPSATATVPAELDEALKPPSTDTVRTASTSDGKAVIVVQSPEAVDDVFARYKAALPSAGYAIDDEDDEGREAELYFSKGGRKGSLLIKRSDCPPGSTRYQLTVPTG